MGEILLFPKTLVTSLISTTILRIQGWKMENIPIKFFIFNYVFVDQFRIQSWTSRRGGGRVVYPPKTFKTPHFIPMKYFSRLPLKICILSAHLPKKKLGHPCTYSCNNVQLNCCNLFLCWTQHNTSVINLFSFKPINIRRIRTGSQLY